MIQPRSHLWKIAARGLISADSSFGRAHPMAPTDPSTPEQLARRRIDAMLEASGWMVQNRAELNLGAGPGVAVREVPTAAGPADYLLFLGNQLVGVLEA